MGLPNVKCTSAQQEDKEIKLELSTIEVEVKALTKR